MGVKNNNLDGNNSGNGGASGGVSGGTNSCTTHRAHTVELYKPPAIRRSISSQQQQQQLQQQSVTTATTTITTQTSSVVGGGDFCGYSSGSCLPHKEQQKYHRRSPELFGCSEKSPLSPTLPISIPRPRLAPSSLSASSTPSSLPPPPQKQLSPSGSIQNSITATSNADCFSKQQSTINHQSEATNNFTANNSNNIVALTCAAATSTTTATTPNQTNFNRNRPRRPDRAVYVPRAQRSQTTPPQLSSSSSSALSSSSVYKHDQYLTSSLSTAVIPNISSTTNIVELNTNNTNIHKREFISSSSISSPPPPPTLSSSSFISPPIVSTNLGTVISLKSSSLSASNNTTSNISTITNTTSTTTTITTTNIVAVSNKSDNLNKIFLNSNQSTNNQNNNIYNTAQQNSIKSNNSQLNRSTISDNIHHNNHQYHSQPHQHQNQTKKVLNLNSINSAVSSINSALVSINTTPENCSSIINNSANITTIQLNMDKISDLSPGGDGGGGDIGGNGVPGTNLRIEDAATFTNVKHLNNFNSIKSNCKDDKDIKELERATKEINRNNRRIIKQTFVSDVLEIADKTLPQNDCYIESSNNDFETKTSNTTNATAAAAVPITTTTHIEKQLTINQPQLSLLKKSPVPIGNHIPFIQSTNSNTFATTTTQSTTATTTPPPYVPTIKSINRQKSLDPEVDDWETMFDENGECMNPKLIEDLTATVGKVNIDNNNKPKPNYKIYHSKQTVLGAEEYPHVLEVSNFPVEFKTPDLMMLFSAYKESGLDIKWVDDTHALVVFSNSKIAAEVLSLNHPFIVLKPLTEATIESRTKAKKCSSSLQPYRQRPETCAALARRLVTGALGVRLKTAREELENERKVLREAKEKKLLAAKQRDEAWEN